ncbi:hypothetical protein BJ138DRAFT_1119088 [Hygrophoropsis aurantiaca]|uniref:Uncharacterized protein n=1 Tax=Hygrophoropsis aurantiaca TaxID=72124 RepID=A0ACB7ZV95_9AGAM|nr:hypothetical protein BJ138DRAFT_1119088 [Hygrophoropsis aurantiaca]
MSSPSTAPAPTDVDTNTGHDDVKRGRVTLLDQTDGYTKTDNDEHVAVLSATTDATDSSPTACIPRCCVDVLAGAVIRLQTMTEHRAILREAVRDALHNENSNAPPISISNLDALVYDCPIPGLSTCTLPLVRGLPINTVVPNYSDVPVQYFLPMPGAASPYYSVSRGLAVGIFTNWLVVSLFVTGVSNSIYRAYDTFEEAEAALVDVIHRGGHQIIQ